MTTIETIENAEWKVEGDARLTDSAVHALALLAIDLGKAAEREADGAASGDDHQPTETLR